jgi:hypothetical protein
VHSARSTWQTARSRWPPQRFRHCQGRQCKSFEFLSPRLANATNDTERHQAKEEYNTDAALHKQPPKNQSDGGSPPSKDLLARSHVGVRFPPGVSRSMHGPRIAIRQHRWYSEIRDREFTSTMHVPASSNGNAIMGRDVRAFLRTSRRLCVIAFVVPTAQWQP